LWALPGSGFRDWPKAQAVLDPVLKESGGQAPGVVALVHLLQAYFAEQRRGDDAASGLERRVREEQQRTREEQARVRDEQAKVRDEQQKLRDEQRRAEALQQKLDALKGIEKNLLQRGDRARPPVTR
jgi:predicted ribosome quality control (RQC) complex YloA/Tae2 family protein